MGAAQSTSMYLGTARLPARGLTFTTRRYISSLNVANMNAGGKGKAAVRRRTVGDFLTTYDPSLVFCQEFTRQGVTTKPWEEFELKKTFKYIGDTEASLLYDEAKVKPIPLSATSNDILTKSGLIKDRLMVTVLEDQEDKDKFLGASWHGPHNGYTNEQKEAIFEKLLAVLVAMAKVEKLRVVLAGDFNLDIERSKRLIPKQLQLYQYPKVYLREGKLEIDYFITSKDLLLDDVEAVPLDEESGLDHDIGTGTLTDKQEQ